MSEVLSCSVLASSIPTAGKHFTLEANAAERRQLAEVMEIADVEALVAQVDVRPVGAHNFSVTGTVKATVVQTDVVTLDPVRQELTETIDLTLKSAEATASKPRPADLEVEAEADDSDLYHGGRLDLGRIVGEHLALGLDPYPRSPGVVFEGYEEDEPKPTESPFAVLGALKRDGG